MAKCIRLSNKMSKLAQTAHQRLGQQLREGQGLEGNYDVYNTFYVDKYREHLVDLLKQAEEVRKQEKSIFVCVANLTPAGDLCRPPRDIREVD